MSRIQNLTRSWKSLVRFFNFYEKKKLLMRKMKFSWGKSSWKILMISKILMRKSLSHENLMRFSWENKSSREFCKGNNPFGGMKDQRWSEFVFLGVPHNQIFQMTGKGTGETVRSQKHWQQRDPYSRKLHINWPDYVAFGLTLPIGSHHSFKTLSERYCDRKLPSAEPLYFRQRQRLQFVQEFRKTDRRNVALFHAIEKCYFMRFVFTYIHHLCDWNTLRCKPVFTICLYTFFQ